MGKKKVTNVEHYNQNVTLQKLQCSTPHKRTGISWERVISWSSPTLWDRFNATQRNWYQGLVSL